jgi:hypothetical protein
MDFLQDSTFWWAVVASLYAVVSEYVGSQPRIRENTTYQVILRLIGRGLNDRARRR